LIPDTGKLSNAEQSINFASGQVDITGFPLTFDNLNLIATWVIFGFL
jgi:hypothetical protein